MELRRAAFSRSRWFQKGVIINCKFWNVRTRRGLKDGLVDPLCYVIARVANTDPSFGKVRPARGRCLLWRTLLDPTASGPSSLDHMLRPQPLYYSVVTKTKPLAHGEDARVGFLMDGLGS